MTKIFIDGFVYSQDLDNPPQQNNMEVSYTQRTWRRLIIYDLTDNAIVTHVSHAYLDKSTSTSIITITQYLLMKATISRSNYKYPRSPQSEPQ